MTLHEEPPVVDLDDILGDEEEQPSRVTGLQWALVVVGGVIGIVGSLTVLVLAAPVVLDVATWIDSVNDALNQP